MLLFTVGTKYTRHFRDERTLRLQQFFEDVRSADHLRLRTVHDGHHMTPRSARGSTLCGTPTSPAKSEVGRREGGVGEEVCL